MVIESKYQLYLKNKDQDLRVITNKGRVLFDEKVVYSKKNDTKTPIKRTDNK